MKTSVTEQYDKRLKFGQLSKAKSTNYRLKQANGHQSTITLSNQHRSLLTSNPKAK